MAGNKFNTQFSNHKPKEYKLEYDNVYGDKIILQGNAQQIINAILNHQI